MTIGDLADLTFCSWDTIKNIVKARLETEVGHPRLKDLKRLSIDEIYLGKAKKYGAVVIDLGAGRIVHVAPGKGADALKKFWRLLRLSKAKIQALAMDMSAAYSGPPRGKIHPAPPSCSTDFTLSNLSTKSSTICAARWSTKPRA
jgi:transposase